MKTEESADTFTYRLKPTGESSRKYGPCEVCGDHAGDVWIQAEMRVIGTITTYYGCRQHTFGHQDCLRSIQR